MTKRPDQPAATARLDASVQGLIGTALDRIDGPAKVTGTARYAFEHQGDAPPLYGHIVGATIGCGRVEQVDAAAARAAPGVALVIADDPRLVSDSASGSEDALPAYTREIGYFGQPVALVLADTPEAARAAAALIRIDYTIADGRFDPPALHDAADPDPPRPLIPNRSIGDVDAAMAGAAFTVDAVYTTPHHMPAAMEPHATTAWWEGDRLTVHTSAQGLSGTQRMIAGSMGVPREQVRILSPFVGGGFGGKTGVVVEAVLAAMAARETGRRVKIALLRRQVAHLVHRRSETHQHVRLAADAEGRLTAIAQESIVSQKPGRGFIEPVAFGSLSLYAAPARRFTQALVHVDLPAASAVRAPGEAVGSFGLEIAIDELAEKLGIDPIELRRRNEPENDPMSGKPFSSRQLLACYEEGARRFGWERRSPVPAIRRDGRWWIGHGMAAAFRGNFTVESRARVTLAPDGRATVETDMTDIGTGTYTILAQVAGEMLGLPARDVAVVLGDSALPVSAGSGGSFGAGSSGSAVALACQTIVERLAERMGVEPDAMTLKDGHAIAGNRRVPLADLLGGEALSVEGHATPGAHTRSVAQASYGAHFCEVAVDAVTGEVRVRRMLGVFDCGRVLNLKTTRSQMIGGMIWGIGYALGEEGVIDARTGQFVNPDFGEYHIPVHADVPHLDVHFVGEADGWANEVGAKAAGELGIAGAGAAVANAIYNACGVRVRDMPITLDKLIAGLPEA
ncbi:xanthine dehydrogenase family protein molybdopterin-binding subunit [Sphingomonas baiyangensis]|uniref:Xanthine dehydrogenase family protein molybdopterin-binding subunit n=1 Tax=Sphingomonas baiyangensis TaxID=2572576 RepID=A0A4V6WRH8_9SPHN|nr:xanthine dehydrogenase family protein molybdopterin-binding subunit [Sphingomonas baiyangensis]TKD53228.1 xanthine dehydrogenase family protein molybdopterin-binding subunit [Sphingomonas baiyangensis]